jgi:exosortase B
VAQARGGNTFHPFMTIPNSAAAPLSEARDYARPPLWSVAILLSSFVALYFSSYVELAQTVWNTDEQGHGPLIIAASAWLFWSQRQKIFGEAASPALGAGFGLMVISLLVFILGRSQAIIELAVASQIPMLASMLLILHGPKALRRAWFPLFFLVFMTPLPGSVVQALTMPLKHAVSIVVEQLLYWSAYPIARSGVTLTIGPYQLLVADACSGLNSLFTLESLGLLYMNIMNYKSRVRNILLAAMIVPISFVSNVVRVLILVLVTFYYGDEVGQGFVHSFAGLVLFSVALTLTYGFDSLLAARFDESKGSRGNLS